jgi:DNA ligase-1
LEKQKTLRILYTNIRAIMASFNEQLADLHIFVEQMQATSSSLDKVEILKKTSPFIQKVLEYTYDPYKQYNLTAKTLIKNKDMVAKYGYYDLFYLLDALNKRTITGHDAIAHVNGFMVGLDLQGKELVCRIIDKDLEIRAGAKVINKAIPGLIPEFNVALAQNYEPKLASFGEGYSETWYASRKLDGVRCLAVTDTEGKCTLYSRMGKEFTTLNKIKYAIEATGIINFVFDGEICLLDKDGNEDFQSVMKELRRKDHQIENPTFMIFDMIHKTEFDKGKSTDILSERLHTLRTWLGPRYETKETLRYLGQYAITDERHFDKWGQMATDNNWEGFMLRKDTEYEGKRSKNLLKVKKFHDAEYTVKAVDFDRMRIVKDGREEYLDMLSQVWIEHKGYEVKVGSGFTQEQRLKYTQEPIVGKTITVQYFEETKNDKGGISLRFPTVKHIYENERDC